MVPVAQLVEHRIVIPAVVGSSPIRHPFFGFVFFPTALLHLFIAQLRGIEPRAFARHGVNALLWSKMRCEKQAEG